MSNTAKIIYILQLIVETAGAVYRAGAYNPTDEKFTIYVDRALDPGLVSAMDQIVKILSGKSTATVEVLTS